MIYLLRVVNRSIQIAACEDDKRVPALLAQGYQVVTRDDYIAAWRIQDERPTPQPQERAVGDTPPLPGRWKVKVN